MEPAFYLGFWLGLFSGVLLGVLLYVLALDLIALTRHLVSCLAARLLAKRWKNGSSA